MLCKQNFLYLFFEKCFHNVSINVVFFFINEWLIDLCGDTEKQNKHLVSVYMVYNIHTRSDQINTSMQCEWENYAN
jgi:hypothetical protein